LLDKLQLHFFRDFDFPIAEPLPTEEDREPDVRLSKNDCFMDALSKVWCRKELALVIVGILVRESSIKVLNFEKSTVSGFEVCVGFEPVFDGVLSCNV